MRNRIVVGTIVVVAVFLLGFLPQYVRARRLDDELRQAQAGSAGARLRDLAALTYVQANQKNYGLAAESSARFFNAAREVAAATADPERKRTLEAILSQRDNVTAQLAKGDAAVMATLQDVFLKTRDATRGPGD
jgi:hypothetical protein